MRKKQVSTYVYFILFLFLGLIATLASGGAFEGVTISFGMSNKVLINSPVGLNQMIGLIGCFCLFIMAPVFGQAVFKDYGAGIDQIVYGTSTHRKGFLVGRFAGAFLTLAAIQSGIGLGIWLGTLAPAVQQNLIGANHLLAYLVPYLTSLLPNTFVFGSIFFLMASRTKKMGPVYIAGILIFMAWMASGSLTSDLDNKWIVSLIDPFGLNSVGELTKYWSIAEQNSRFVTLTGYFFYNRVLWGLIGLGCFLWAVFGFSSTRKVKRSSTEKAQIQVGVVKGQIASSVPDFSRGSYFSMFLKQTHFELNQILKSIYFQTILLAGVLYIFIVSTQVGKLYGTVTYPVTYKVIELMGGTFELFILIILTFYAGESVWRERNLKVDEILDAFPAPTWTTVFSKFTSLLVMTLLLLITLAFCGMAVQAFKGYSNFEIGLYFQHLFLIKFLSFVNIAVLAFFIQTVCNSKYVGHGIMIGYYILYTWLPTMGFEHKMYRFNASSLPVYSDMNGFGRFLEGYYTFKIFWFAVACLLLLGALIFWQRGGLFNKASRLREAKRRFRAPHSLAVGACVLLIVSLGSKIYYNTNVLNKFETTKELENQSFDYEKKYKRYEGLVQPQVVGVKAAVDIFPYKAKIAAKMSYTLKNKSDVLVKKIFVNMPLLDKPQIRFQRAVHSILKDESAGVEIFELVEPMKPGQELGVEYSIVIDRSAFPNASPDTKIVKNGTFFSNGDYFPEIGYQERAELFSSKTRAKYGLKPKKRMPEIGDENARQFTPISSHGTWIDFEAIVSTAHDQIAISPGYLVKEWKKNGRRYFHYKMDQKILNFYSFLSGKYHLHKDRWNGVNIEVFFHPTHGANVEKMVESTKLSLDYFTKNFGPYQHKQFRIIEFPRYASFAQAFPNTIPFSESIGFIAKLDENDPKAIDMPFYVTAHELAHQWWAHQVIGGNVQGATMLSETFSQYSALMVMEKKYGKQNMKRFLKYELDRYLSGRKLEDEIEHPLYLNESQQYIHYNKGSLAMYALQDYVGEEVVNKALRSFIQKVAFQDSPFTTSVEFLEVLKSTVPVEHHPLVSDLFEKIVLFENRPLESNFEKQSSGKYKVKLMVSSQKFYADGQGKEVEAPFRQKMYVGIEGRDGQMIYYRKHDIENGTNEIVLEVDEKPIKAGVDPLNILIDKNSRDNWISVSEKSS